MCVQIKRRVKKMDGRFKKLDQYFKELEKKTQIGQECKEVDGYHAFLLALWQVRLQAPESWLWAWWME